MFSSTHKKASQYIDLIIKDPKFIRNLENNFSLNIGATIEEPIPDKNGETEKIFYHRKYKNSQGIEVEEYTKEGEGEKGLCYTYIDEKEEYEVSVYNLAGFMGREQYLHRIGMFFLFTVSIKNDQVSKFIEILRNEKDDNKILNFVKVNIDNSKDIANYKDKSGKNISYIIDLKNIKLAKLGLKSILFHHKFDNLGGVMKEVAKHVGLIGGAAAGVAIGLCLNPLGFALGAVFCVLEIINTSSTVKKSKNINDEFLKDFKNLQTILNKSFEILIEDDIKERLFENNLFIIAKSRKILHNINDYYCIKLINLECIPNAAPLIDFDQTIRNLIYQGYLDSYKKLLKDVKKEFDKNVNYMK